MSAEVGPFTRAPTQGQASCLWPLGALSSGEHEGHLGRSRVQCGNRGGGLRSRPARSDSPQHIRAVLSGRVSVLLVPSLSHGVAPRPPAGLRNKPQEPIRVRPLVQQYLLPESLFCVLLFHISSLQAVSLVVPVFHCFKSLLPRICCALG